VVAVKVLFGVVLGFVVVSLAVMIVIGLVS
jgi:hypothetical protein